MLNECGLLMVPPSREGCYNIRRKASLCLDSDYFNRGGLLPEDFVLEGIATTVVGSGDEVEEETGVHVSDDIVVLAPSLPSLPLAAVVASPVDGDAYVWKQKQDELHSVMTYPTEFCSIASAQRPVFFPCRAGTAEGMICAGQNGGQGLASKENGFGVAEKRMRDAEGLVLPAGNQSGDSLSNRVLFEDCPEAPLRKRVHICENELGGLAGDMNAANLSRTLEGFVGTVARLNGEKLSDSDEIGGLPARIPPTPLRTEGNGEGGDAEGRGVEGGDVQLSPEGLEETTERDEGVHRSTVPVVEAAVTEATDMEVDASSSEDVVVEHGESPATDEQVSEAPMRQPSVFERDGEDGEEGEGRPEAFADYVGEEKRSSSNTTNHLHEAGPSRVHPPPGNAPNGFPQGRPNIEVIEFDDSSDDDLAETNGHESDGSSTKGKKPISHVAGQQRRAGYRLSSSESTASSFSPDEDSDSDDCQVIGSRRPQYRQPPDSPGNPVVVEDDEESDTSSEDSDSSDVAVVGGSQGAIRRMWEEAAMRRRMGRAMRSEGSNADGENDGTINIDDDRTESQGMAESVATSTYHGSLDSKDQTETSEARGGLEGVVNPADGQQGTSSMFPEDQRPGRASREDDAVLPNFNEADGVEILLGLAESGRPKTVSSAGAEQGATQRENPGNGELPGGNEGGWVESLSTGPHSESLKGASSLAADEAADEGGDERLQRVPVEHEGLRDDMREMQEVKNVADEAWTPTASEDLIAAKERLKQTSHYRESDAAEWASRQEEIQRQAVETKRLRQRKRQEVDRRKDMERKQKERIEELRRSQMKEEKNMDIREQLRGQVRVELERVASTCYDFATLLRQLGIPVDGGSQPSTQQVNAAYKKALFKFHPDRAVASNQGDLRHQVEAEEKFKLILRLKNTLVPVAIDYGHPFR